jgi:nucleoside-diphosphate-sugar epimerase
MRVLITGGSGFLGINLVRHCLRLGWDVTVLDRNDFDYPEISAIRFVKGDIRSKDDVDEALRDATSVVHTAAALPLHSPSEIYSVDIDGTRTVLSRSLGAGIKRFVHISSTAVYGVPKKHPIYESDPMVGVGPYGKAKIEAEHIADSFRDTMTVTILRPKSFIGPERLGVFALLYDWAISGAHFPIPGRGTNLYQYLDVSDLCKAIELSITSPAELANDTFNIGAERFGTFKEDFQHVLDLAGFGRKVVGLPASPAIWTLRILDKLGLSPLYPWVYETAVKDSFVSIEKIRDQLGFSPVFSNKEALQRNFDWYKSNRDSFAGKSGKTHRVPWKQGALGLAKSLFKI